MMSDVAVVYRWYSEREPNLDKEKWVRIEAGE